jgi:hypothetical protein
MVTLRICISNIAVSAEYISASPKKNVRAKAVRTARVQSQLDAKYSAYTPALRAGKQACKAQVGTGER